MHLKNNKLTRNKPSQESMSNADIKSLQKVVGEYSLNKVLNTIAVIADIDVIAAYCCLLVLLMI